MNNMLFWIQDLKHDNKISRKYPFILPPVPLGKTSMKKKNVFLRALPESPKPPPWPQFGQLGPLFLRQKRRFARMTEIFFDDDNDGFNDTYDDNFDDNYDKND